MLQTIVVRFNKLKAISCQRAIINKIKRREAWDVFMRLEYLQIPCAIFRLFHLFGILSPHCRDVRNIHLQTPIKIIRAHFFANLFLMTI